MNPTGVNESSVPEQRARPSTTCVPGGGAVRAVNVTGVNERDPAPPVYRGQGRSKDAIARGYVRRGRPGAFFLVGGKGKRSIRAVLSS